MTYKGAIKQLYEMRDTIWMPEFFKPYFDKIIETLTDDVRENVRGEWIDAQYPFSKCSICDCYFDTANNETNFCPNCGADMRGD